MTDYLQQAVDALGRGDLHSARDEFKRSLVCAHHNLAYVLWRLGEPGAEKHYRAALEIAPNFPDTALSFAAFLLAQGRYTEAWPLHEQRRHVRRVVLTQMPSTRSEWRGEDLSGRRLLVVREQGFGDQIMFARFSDLLRQRGADVTLMCDEPLLKLLSGERQVRLSDFDFWVYQQSIPRWLGTTVDTIPPPVSLPVRWRGGGGGVGVVPTGNAAGSRNRARVLSDGQIHTLLSLGRDLRPEATGAADFYQTAEIMAGLDLVVTVDTAAAHLAGSMGVPTWVLLPASDADWRWLEHRNDSPWYPSVRLYRQAVAGDWDGAIARIRADCAGRFR